MIVGIGCDLTEHRRIQASVERVGERFVRAFLSEPEFEEWKRRCVLNTKRGFAFLAGRWAAKEAVAKSLGTGVRGDVRLQDIIVLNDELGAPYLQFEGALADRVRRENLKFHISLSDTDTLSMASVVCERI